MVDSKNAIFIFFQEIKANSMIAINSIFRLSEYDPPSLMRFSATKFEKINNIIINFTAIISYLFLVCKNFDVIIVAKIYAKKRYNTNV